MVHLTSSFSLMNWRDVLPFLVAIPLAVAIGAAGNDWGAGTMLAVVAVVGIVLVACVAVAAAPRVAPALSALDQASLERIRASVSEEVERVQRELEERLKAVHRESEMASTTSAWRQEALGLEDQAQVAQWLAAKVFAEEERLNVFISYAMRERHENLMQALEEALAEIAALSERADDEGASERAESVGETLH